MKTKRFFLAALTVMCAMATTSVMTACGDDDDKDNSGNNQGQDDQGQTVQTLGKILDLRVDFQLTADDYEAIQYVSSDGKLMVKYLDANGAEQTGEFASATYKNSLTFAFNTSDTTSKARPALLVYLNGIDSAKFVSTVGRKKMRIISETTAIGNFENKKNHPMTLGGSSSTEYGIFVADSLAERGSQVLYKKAKKAVAEVGYLPLFWSDCTVNSKGVVIGAYEGENYWKVNLMNLE